MSLLSHACSRHLSVRCVCGLDGTSSIYVEISGWVPGLNPEDEAQEVKSEGVPRPPNKVP
jgi:hypothetical protein